MLGQDDIQTMIDSLLDNVQRASTEAVRLYKEGNYAQSFFQFQVLYNMADSLKSISEVKAVADVGYDLMGQNIANNAEEYLHGNTTEKG
ncbi:MAG: hypothetical protein LC650_00150 [Actinobacteria bacterium]|nr:hypothetical protein [Actinomycetota bacterium]